MNINNLPYIEEISESLPCIYALVDPIDKEIRYIGKSTLVQFRYYQHLNAAPGESNPLYKWMNQLIVKNLRPRLFVLEVCTEVDASDKEKEWIKKVNDTGARLLNFGERRFYNYSPRFLNKIAHVFNGELITKTQIACTKPLTLWCANCKTRFSIPGLRLIKGHWCPDCTKTEAESTGKSLADIRAAKAAAINHILSEMRT